MTKQEILIFLNSELCGTSSEDSDRIRLIWDIINLVRKLDEPPQKTGVQLIAEERQEQIEKHGYYISTDAQFHREGELIKAALFAINPWQFEWPFHWNKQGRDKVLGKSKIDRLKVAGAFIAAEIDIEQYRQNEQK